MLGRAGRLTPGGLREAVARAVMDVAPGKARKRREAAQKDARVQRWAEDSGNAALMGRELPPAEVLAADQRITAWAHELRSAGLEGGMDELRARAYLDLLLGKDSRPLPGDAGTAAPGDGGTNADSSADTPGGSGPGGPGAGVVPAGFAVRGTLDGPAGDAGPAGGPARGAGRDRACRPVAGPGPGRRGGPAPEDDLVRDRHRRAGARGSARLRPARTQGTRENREDRAGPGGTPGRAGRVQLHPRGAGRAAGRVRDLAAADPRGRAGPHHRALPAGY